MKSKNILGAAIAALSIGALASAAHATVTCLKETSSTAPTSCLYVQSTIPDPGPDYLLFGSKLYKMNGTVYYSANGMAPYKTVSKPVYYDFTFTLSKPVVGFTSIQAEAQMGATTTVNEDISFDLYKGTPGSGSLVGTSTIGTNADLDKYLLAGSYYIEIAPSQITVSGEKLSGSVAVTVPEPTSWALMVLGVGVIGGALRGRRRLAVA